TSIEDDTLTANVKVGNYCVKAIIDTGSKVNLVTEMLLEKIQYNVKNATLPYLQTVGDNLVQPIAAIETILEINGKSLQIIAYVINNPNFSLLLGLETCRQAELSIKFCNSNAGTAISSTPVRVFHTKIIPAETCTWVKVRAKLPRGDYY